MYIYIFIYDNKWFEVTASSVIMAQSTFGC